MSALSKSIGWCCLETVLIDMLSRREGIERGERRAFPEDQ
jgi:hypothetical protein